MSNPKIYVACLASYNNGILHGAWIDVLQDEVGIQQDINAMLAKSPVAYAEEWAIHDYEGFEGYNLSEYASVETVHRIAVFISENGLIAGKLLEYFSGNLEEAETGMENCAGLYKCIAVFAEELTEQTTNIPDNLRYYIDYERMAKDMELSGDIFTIEVSFEGVYVFWNS